MPETVESPNQTATAPPAEGQALKTRPEQDTEPEHEPLFHVLLHNDEVNVFENVVRWLNQLVPLTMQHAYERTDEAHRRGKSIVLSTHKERAELCVEQADVGRPHREHGRGVLERLFRASGRQTDRH